MVYHINANQTVNEMIRDHPETLKIFHKYGIDSCCGGSHSIKKAVTARRIPLQMILSELLNEMRRQNHGHH